MIELGKMHKLEIINKSQLGYYLKSKSDKSNASVLLPHKQVSQELRIGQEIEVFVYTDSDEKIIASFK